MSTIASSTPWRQPRCANGNCEGLTIEAAMPTRSVLVGLIGAGIQASRAPRLHEQEGCDQGLRYLYRLIDLDVLGLSVEALPVLLTPDERLGFTGVDITFL